MEFEIAGADYEIETNEFCVHCDEDQDGTEMGYRDDRWFICSACGKQTDLPSREYDDGPDPDREYDLRIEEGY